MPSRRLPSLTADLYSDAWRLLGRLHRMRWPAGEPTGVFAHDGVYRVRITVEPGLPGDALSVHPVPIETLPGTPLTKIETAIQLYLRDPGQSMCALARKVPCSPSLLSRSKDFRRLRAAHVREQRHGTKYDGTADA